MVAFVPDTLLMTTQGALEHSSTCKVIQEKGLLDQLRSRVVVPLAVYLMEQRRDPESHWASYFAAMNPDLSNHLMFWTEEELEWLKGSEIIGYNNQLKRKINGDYQLLSENIPGFAEQFSERDF